MALKYWYKAANGSDNWAVASNWYNGPGGTGGTTTVPTAVDDVVIDAASGSGTITIAAAATCLSLDCTGFTGTLAGASTLAFLGSVTLSSAMTLTYSGTATLGNGSSIFTSNGKTVTFNITVNNANAQFFTNGDLTMSSTNILTLSSGLTAQWTPSSISVGFFVSTGSAARILDAPIYLTGIGTVWSVSGTNFGVAYPAYITNISSSAKTISHTATTASSTFGGNFRQSFYITGAGVGSYTLTGNFQDLYFANTGGASFSFGNSNIAGTFDLGYINPTCNMIWNNGATTLTFNADDVSTINIGQNITITASPALSYTNATGYSGSINNPYNKSLTGAITINTPNAVFYSDNLRTTGTLTITAGALSSNDVYCSSISSSNANARDITIGNILYLTGTGTLVTATTTTNLTTSIPDIYVTNSSATAKSLTLNTVFYASNGVYLAGSGSGTITLAAGTSALFTIYVTNTGGAAISFSTATIKSIEFSPGTNAVWATASTGQTLTITNSLFIAPSAGNPTLTPALIFTGNDSYSVYVTLSGKSLVSGTCTLNDSSFFANGVQYFFDGFSSNAAFTVTSAAAAVFSGAFSGPSYTSTSTSGNIFGSSLTLTGALSLANNTNFGNGVQVNGNFSAATVSHLGFGTIELTGTTNNVTTSITLNNAASLAQLYHTGTLTTPTFTITNGGLASYGNLNCTTLTVSNGDANFFNNVVTLAGVFTLTAGALYSDNATFSSTTFVCSTTTNFRNVSLNNSSWTLTGTGTVWNLVDGGNLNATVSSLDIYITNTSATSTTFAGASQNYGRLFINRGAINANQVIITGSNYFKGLYHTGGSAQTLTFTAGTTTYIFDTFAVGSSSANTNINSTSTGATFTIIKFSPGLVICNNVSITRSAATPANTWYAVNSTSVAGNSGWIFGPPSRRLGSLGTG